MTNALHSTALRRFLISFGIVVGSAAVVGGSAFLADLQRCGVTPPPGSPVVGTASVFGCAVDTNAIGLILLTALVSGCVRALLGAVTDMHSLVLAPGTVATTPVNAVGSAVGPTTLALETPVPTPPAVAAVAPVAAVIPPEAVAVSSAPAVTPSILLEK